MAAQPNASAKRWLRCAALPDCREPFECKWNQWLSFRLTRFLRASRKGRIRSTSPYKRRLRHFRDQPPASELFVRKRGHQLSRYSECRDSGTAQRESLASSDMVLQRISRFRRRPAPVPTNSDPTNLQQLFRNDLKGRLVGGLRRLTRCWYCGANRQSEADRSGLFHR